MIKKTVQIFAISHRRYTAFFLKKASKAGDQKTETESDAEKKKKNQRKEDIRVYITMAVICSLAAIVTVLKVVLRNVMFPSDNKNETTNAVDFF